MPFEILIIDIHERIKYVLHVLFRREGMRVTLSYRTIIFIDTVLVLYESVDHYSDYYE